MGNKVKINTKKELITKLTTYAGEKKNAEALLKVEDLSLSFTQYASGLRQTELKVISNLSLQAYKGEILAVKVFWLMRF